MLLTCALSSLIHAQEVKDSPSDLATNASEKEKPIATPEASDYRIGVGDTLDITVERRPELSWRGQVNSDGDISGLPYLNNPVHVLCLTEQVATDQIKTAYSPLIKSPAVTVNVIERSSLPVYLLGAIRTPQRFQLQRDAKLIELLFISGGVTERASGDIQIFSPIPSPCMPSGQDDQTNASSIGSTIRVLKIMDLMSGTVDANPLIRPGDIVTVMAAEPVYVTGGVVSPQGINFRDQLTLLRAIATVGGLTDNARGSEIRIYRRAQGPTEGEVIKADYNLIKKQKQRDIPLRAYDIIEVPQSSGSSGRRTWQSAAQDIIGDEKKSGELPLRVLN